MRKVEGFGERQKEGRRHCLECVHSTHEHSVSSPAWPLRTRPQHR